MLSIEFKWLNFRAVNNSEPGVIRSFKGEADYSVTVNGQPMTDEIELGKDIEVTFNSVTNIG